MKQLTESTALPHALDLHDDLKTGRDILRQNRGSMKDPYVRRCLAEHGYDVKVIDRQIRVTPEPVTELYAQEIFVYGANTLGVHGAGAAKMATRWGARFGETGWQGSTYGICTKTGVWSSSTPTLRTMSLEEIAVEVDRFRQVCIETFPPPASYLLVTAIGTGLAGYQVSQIAPMFRPFVSIPNVCLPASFWAWLDANPESP